MTRLKQLFNALGRGVQSGFRFLLKLARPLSFLSFKVPPFPRLPHVAQYTPTQPYEGALQSEVVYRGAPLDRLEQWDMERLFAKLFSSDDGRKVLAYLQMITFHRVLASNANSVELRYIEGQRALVAQMLRLIDRGRQG
jgi:hypothetical protein